MLQQQIPQSFYLPSLGYSYEYANVLQAQQYLQNALINWYLAARTLNTAQPNIPQNTWLQLQAPPQGNAPGAILYNCGGINLGIANGFGGFGIDFANQGLYQWLVAHPNIAVPGLGNVVLTVEPNPTVKVTPFNNPLIPNSTTHYQTEYHAVTCIAATIQYNPNDPSHLYWGSNIWSQDGTDMVQLAGGVRYNIVLNFHLYVGQPQPAQAPQPHQPHQITLADFM